MAAKLVHPLIVSVTAKEYVPLVNVVDDAIDGFCEVDVKPFGPVQL